MKKRILILGVLLITTSYQINANNFYEINYNSIKNIVLDGIKDGWYSSTVKYSNYSTGTFATYTLDVKVESNRIVRIDFGNGGSVHSGYNEYGYIYSGGYLYFEKDYKGNTIAATASVSISDSNGLRDYKIRIE